MFISLKPTQYKSTITIKNPILNRKANNIFNQPIFFVSCATGNIYSFFLAVSSSTYLINKKNKQSVISIIVVLIAECS